MIIKILKAIISILFILLALVGIYFIFNGGSSEFSEMIKEDGFFGFLAEFFAGIGTGIKETLF